jgi:hypothetical protein
VLSELLGQAARERLDRRIGDAVAARIRAGRPDAGPVTIRIVPAFFLSICRAAARAVTKQAVAPITIGSAKRSVVVSTTGVAPRSQRIPIALKETSSRPAFLTTASA